MELGNYGVGWDGLVALAEQGHVEHILRILEKDLNLIYTTNMVRETVLHVVARTGNALIVSKLIKLNGNHQVMKKVLLKQNVDGDTALHLAIKLKHKEVAFQLVGRNMHNLLNKDGLSPTDLAKEVGWVMPKKEVPRPKPEASLACTEMRVSRIDIELEELYKVKWIEGISTPRGIRGAFSKASANGVIKTMNIECELGQIGGNLLHIAARLGKVDVLKLLVKFMNSSELASLPLEMNNAGNTALHLALMCRHEVSALYLIKVAPNAAYLLNRDGKSPLYWAIERQN